MRRLVFVFPWMQVKEDIALQDDHTARLLEEHRGKDELEVTTFNLQEGTITTDKYDRKGKRIVSIIVKKHSRYTSGDSQKKREEKLELLSKKTIYDFIMNIGKNHSGELYGISFYSEYEGSSGVFFYWWGDEKKIDALSLVEFRPTDFSVARMSSAERNNFAKAFNVNAINFVTTGAFSAYYDYIFIYFLTDKFLFINNETPFDLTKLPHKGRPTKRIIEYFKVNFPQANLSSMPFKYIKSYFCYKLTSTYAYALARISNCVTYSHLPGQRILNPYFWEYLWAFSQNEYLKKVQLNTMELKYISLFYQRYMGFGKPMYNDLLWSPYSPKYTCEFLNPPDINWEVIAPPVFEVFTNKHYIFVAGVDYKRTDIDFDKACASRIYEILELGKPGDNMVFHLFDFLNGKKRIKTGGVQKDGTTFLTESDNDVTAFSKINVLKDYKRLKDQNGREEYYFVKEEFYIDKAPNYILTISQVYQLILLHVNTKSPRSIPYPGKIKEIHFFSHGDEEGPIVFNSVRKLKGNEVDEDGKRKEFPEKWLDPETSDLGLPLFDISRNDDKNVNILRDVMDHDAVVTINGCNSDNGYTKLIKAITESNEYKAGSLSSDTIITLKNPGKELKQFLKKKSLKGSKQSTALKLKYQLADLLLFFRGKLMASYMLNMAVVTQRPVYGGLPGLNTYIIETKDGALMNVEPEFRKYFKFYERHFGFENDKEMLKKNRFIDNSNNWFDPDKTGGYAKYVHDFLWIEKEGLEGVKF